MKALWSFIFSQSIKAKMEELHPLIPVLESYKADRLLVKQFKEEAANVTEMLGMLQQQLGGLDYQELHSRVIRLEDRLKACMQKLGTRKDFAKYLLLIYCIFTVIILNHFLFLI